MINSCQISEIIDYDVNDFKREKRQLIDYQLKISEVVFTVHRVFVYLREDKRYECFHFVSLIEGKTTMIHYGIEKKLDDVYKDCRVTIIH